MDVFQGCTPIMRYEGRRMEEEVEETDDGRIEGDQEERDRMG